MKRIAYPAGILLAGMLLSHLVFTAFVHHSNLLLHEKLLMLKSSGYMVIPNDHVMGGLLRIFPAFCGALFFTFTIGAGLTLLAFAGAWMHDRLFRRSPIFSVFLLVMWIIVLVALNADGLNPTGTVAVVLVPPAVYFLTRRWIPPIRTTGDRIAPAVHIAAILLVAAIWIPRFDSGIFTHVRDLLLLEHPAGKAVNSFYYQYTLYAAELFKSTDQKLLKTACIEKVENNRISEKIKKRLAVYDYLAVPAGTTCDLHIKQAGPYLLFSGVNNELQTTSAAFLSETEAILEKFSEAQDVNRFFRLMTLSCLVAAFPLSLYVLVHAFFSLLLGFVRPVFPRSVVASCVCAAIGAGAALPLYAAPPARSLNPHEIERQLKADDWRARRGALQAISNQGRDPFDFPVDRKMARSPHTAIRYWLARSVGNSKNTDALPMLLELLDDPQPNVSCMAYYGLGRQGTRQARDEILSRIGNIRHWYVQWYAYKSLKRTGWVQQLSDTPPSPSP